MAAARVLCTVATKKGYKMRLTPKQQHEITAKNILERKKNFSFAKANPLTPQKINPEEKNKRQEVIHAIRKDLMKHNKDYLLGECDTKGLKYSVDYTKSQLIDIILGE